MVTIREDPYPFLHKIGVQNQNHNDAVSNVESTTTAEFQYEQPILDSAFVIMPRSVQER